MSALQLAFRFDHDRWRPLSATRCAIGVAIPLLAAAAFGSPVAGVLAGVGAIYAGVSSYNGAYGARLRVLLAVSICMAAVTMLGTIASAYVLTAMLCVSFVAFTLGLYSQSSAAAQSVAVQSTSIIIVLSGLPIDPSRWLGNGLLVLGGGLTQALLLGVVWPVNPRYPERKALADVFLSLASYVAALPRESPEIPDPVPFEDAWSVLNEAQRLHPRLEHQSQFQALRTAEFVRASLVGYRSALLADAESTVRDPLLNILEASLRQVASNVRLGAPAGRDVALSEASMETSPEVARWSKTLREAMGLLQHPVSGETIEPSSSDDATLLNRPRGWSAVVAAITGLPNVEPVTSLAVQHAARYACAILVSSVLATLWKLPHGFWLPLTVALVLRQDYASTISRAVSRLSGTLIGVLVATLVNKSLHPTPDELLVLMVAAAWLGFAWFQVNYGAFSMMITIYVVFSISASGVYHTSVGQSRILATALGGVIAVITNFVWPMWQSRQVNAVLIEAVGAQIEYGERLKSMVQSGVLWDMDALRQRARSLRTQAEKLVTAAGIEPSWSREHNPALAHEAMLKIDMNAASLLAQHAEAVGSCLGSFPPDPSLKERVEASLNRAFEVKSAVEARHAFVAERKNLR